MWVCWLIASILAYPVAADVCSLAVNQTVLYPAQDDESPSLAQFKIDNFNAARYNQQVYVKFGVNLGFIPGNRSWNHNPEHPYVEGMLTSRQGYDEILVHVENGYEVVIEVEITHYCRQGCCTPVYDVSPIQFPVIQQSNPCQFSSGSGSGMAMDNDTGAGSGAVFNYPTFSVAIIAIAANWCVA